MKLGNIVFLYALLAHLLGDFVLQTNKLAKSKAEGNKGIIIHTLIILIVHLACLSIFGVKGIMAGIVITVIHAMIDKAKLRLTKGRKELLSLFVLDQLLHLLSILITLRFIRTEDRLLQHEQYIVLWVCVFIISTYVSSIIIKQLLIDGGYIDVGQGFFLPKERKLDMLIGGISTVLLLTKLNHWIQLVIVGGVAISVLRGQYKKYKFNRPVIMIKASVYSITFTLIHLSYYYMFTKGV